MTTKDGKLRALSATERELIMGFSADFTIGALKSGAASADKGADHETRCSFIGNSMHVVGTAWLLSHLALERGYLVRLPTFEELWEGDTDKLVATAAGEALAR